jgi:hypothetical protein
MTGSSLSVKASPRLKRILRWSGAALLGLYALLLIPDSEPVPPPPAARSPFAWNQDARWKALEAQFAAARGGNREELRAALARAAMLVTRLAGPPLAAADPVLDEVEEAVFSLGARVAASPQDLAAYVALVGSVRDAVKDQSIRWDMGAPATRHRLYRLLYGGRAAVEEALSQAPVGTVPALTPGRDEASGTPSAVVQGVRLHSGDILLSRGDAPTSALIARGNDFPGNFSHVALVHVDPASSKVSVIEAHIQLGVAIATMDEYLADRKLRILALRPRADLPALVKDPMLPHRAAAGSLENARSRHVPYDFSMDFKDRSRLFCSEVASAAYEEVGVRLWMGLSTISSPGLLSWLSAFGVRNSLTEEPSDLEYDPQLRVVAEWRDPETLLQDRLDNAVIDAMLEGAERGERLGYNPFMLPALRVMKGWSVLLNLVGGVGPVPEGMSATGALKLDRFRTRHAALKASLLSRVQDFKSRNGYSPPYWELVKLAR